MPTNDMSVLVALFEANPKLETLKLEYNIYEEFGKDKLKELKSKIKKDWLYHEEEYECVIKRKKVIETSD